MARPAILTVLLLALLAAPGAFADDRHAGYYYPEPTLSESYAARAETLPESGRRQRIGFVVAVMEGVNANPYPPVVSVFAKGTDAEKLIIVAMEPGRLNTIYRVRAYLAALTSEARQTQVFHDNQVEEIFTFLDLLKMLGFSRLTVSDGDAFTYQVDIE